MELELGGTYQQLGNKSGSRHTSCTNVWLGLIFFAVFVQMAVVATAGVVGYMFYDANIDNIESWANLPWSEMAGSVGTSYTSLQKTPVEGTLMNAYEASSTVNKLLSYHKENTLVKLEEFVNEASNNKNLFQHIHSASIQLLPAINALRTTLKDENVEDISIILKKIKNNVQSLSDDELKKMATTTGNILNVIQTVFTQDKVDAIASSVKSLTKTIDKTFTEENINASFKLMKDVDHTVMRAETTASSIGQILGKV